MNKYAFLGVLIGDGHLMVGEVLCDIMLNKSFDNCKKYNTKIHLITIFIQKKEIWAYSLVSYIIVSNYYITISLLGE